MSALRNCPVCAAVVQRIDYCCRECGHVLQEVVQLELAFRTRGEVQDQFGRFPNLESLFVPSGQAVPEGTLVELRLVLPDAWGALTVPARVMAMAPTPSTPATPYRLHLKATKVELDKQARLRSLVAGEPFPEPPRAEAGRSYPAPPLVPPGAAPEPLPDRDPEPEPDPDPLDLEPEFVLRRWPAPLVMPEELAPPAPPEPPVAVPPEPPVPVIPPSAAAAPEEELDIDIEELLRPLVRAQAPPAADEAGDAAASWEVRERPPEQVSALLTEFVTRFTRAVTKVSYYEAGHQAARDAKSGLYDSFRELTEGGPEVTFLSQSNDTKRSMLVYGVFEEPTDLARVLMRGQADVFVPKLLGWFEGRALLSISFKRALDHDEFYRFVDLLATRPTPPAARRAISWRRWPRSASTTSPSSSRRTSSRGASSPGGWPWRSPASRRTWRCCRSSRGPAPGTCARCGSRSSAT